jgi:hypothetical protein
MDFINKVVSFIAEAMPHIKEIILIGQKHFSKIKKLTK